MLACAMTKPRNPFSALEELRALLPQSNERSPANTENTQAPLTVGKPGPARAVVRMERKGRGGKEATVIEKLDLPAAHLEDWCKHLKQALGCGGTVDGTNIVLQGDLRQRITPVLIAKGVRKVTLG